MKQESPFFRCGERQGDDGNPNTVTLEWRRTNMDYYDTLEDDCHFYSYGLDLLKEFNDGKGNVANVQFKIWNNTDKYWVQAALNEAEGVYYVTDHVDAEADATTFVPVEGTQKIIVKGLEDDEYVLAAGGILIYIKRRKPEGK